MKAQRLASALLRSSASSAFGNSLALGGCNSARIGASGLRFYSSSFGSSPNPATEQQQEKSEKSVSQYWGTVPKEIFREDGTKWPWNSFLPRDTYAPDLSIDVKAHQVPTSFSDKVAFSTVKMLRVLVDKFFGVQHVYHAVLLETVAAVPGMVGGMLLHCKSLRRFEHSGGWIKALLEEAENERMHLMTMIELFKPKWYQRALVLAVQGVFFNSYFVLYVVSPRIAHRAVGYLEEEAVRSYTAFLEALEKGEIPNTPAPAIAVDYWRLPKDATLLDTIMAIRSDEAHHRDVNHLAANIHSSGKQLHAAPAPLVK